MKKTPTAKTYLCVKCKKHKTKNLTDQGVPICERCNFKVVAPIHVPRIGRNDPCPCGSGQKFKNCHQTTSNLEKTQDGATLHSGEAEGRVPEA